MFIMIYNHYFEYQYVWQHSSKSLPTRYMISCFWEGQEGSFLLWIFWNILLGLILIRITKKWKPSSHNCFANTSILKAPCLLEFMFNIKIGSSLFVLVRNLDENIRPTLDSNGKLHLHQIVPQFMDGRGLEICHFFKTIGW